MIKISFYNQKFDENEYGIVFETDNYEFYEKIKDYITVLIKIKEREEVRVQED